MSFLISKAHHRSVGKRKKDYLVPIADDGLIVDDVGPWVVDKYRLMGMYSEIFSTGMKNVRPHRIYVDLYSGSGHSLIKGTRKRMLASPLLALTVPDRFAEYIYCEKNEERIEALRTRATRTAPDANAHYIRGDVNDVVSSVADLIPRDSGQPKVLSFCFVDPYDIGIHFNTIKTLAGRGAMDFLILLALGMDTTRNWQTYLNPENRKVDLFLGDSTWRSRWVEAEKASIGVIRFVATEYANAMSRLGYLTSSIDQMIEIRTYDNNMRLYYLAFFSKNKIGYRYWAQVRKYYTDQIGLDLPDA